MFNKNYTHDLKFGEMKEKELADILLNQEIEVKTDKMFCKTGNVAVEYESRGKPSGISKTKAKYWVFILVDRDLKTESMVLIPTSRLKKIARRYLKTDRDVHGGDLDEKGIPTSRMILIPAVRLVI